MMDRHTDSGHPGRLAALMRPGKAAGHLGGIAPLPLLHIVGGGSGFIDEIITVALIGGAILSVVLAILGIRGKQDNRDE